MWVSAWRWTAKNTSFEATTISDQRTIICIYQRQNVWKRVVSFFWCFVSSVLCDDIVNHVELLNVEIGITNVESWRLNDQWFSPAVAATAVAIVNTIHPLTVISICSYKCFRLVFNDLYGGKDTIFYVRFITHTHDIPTMLSLLLSRWASCVNHHNKGKFDANTKFL